MSEANDVSPRGTNKKHMKDIITDIREFIKENRNIVYWLIVVILLDHFLFEGKFREKI